MSLGLLKSISAMTDRLHVLVIVPCFNEQESIGNLFAELQQAKQTLPVQLDILVVNDCSKDHSKQVLDKLGCNYLDLPVNLGIGGAMQAGYRYAARKNYDIAVQMDGDGQHPADQLMAVIRPLLSDEADVVIGSRFIDKVGFQSTALRRAGISYFRWLNQILIKKTIHDSTSGFRAFNRKTIEIVSKYYPDEYPEPESIVQFGLHKLRIVEVSVIMRERQGGVSSINNSQAIYYMLKVTLGILFVFVRLSGKRLLK